MDWDSIVFEEVGGSGRSIINIPQFWDYITSSSYVYRKRGKGN